MTEGKCIFLIMGEMSFESLNASGRGNYVAAMRSGPTGLSGVLGELIADGEYKQAKQNVGNPDSLAPLNSQR